MFKKIYTSTCDMINWVVQTQTWWRVVNNYTHCTNKLLKTWQCSRYINIYTFHAPRSLRKLFLVIKICCMQKLQPMYMPKWWHCTNICTHKNINVYLVHLKGRSSHEYCTDCLKDSLPILELITIKYAI